LTSNGKIIIKLSSEILNPSIDRFFKTHTQTQKKKEKRKKKKRKRERIKKREKDALHYLIKPPSSTLH
jgi:hypothetical protein